MQQTQTFGARAGLGHCQFPAGGRLSIFDNAVSARIGTVLPARLQIDPIAVSIPVFLLDQVGALHGIQITKGRPGVSLRWRNV